MTARERRQAQLAARHVLSEVEDREQQTIRAAIVLFCSQLDEQQRQLFAGLESLKSGRGWDRQLAHLLGLNEETVARGRRGFWTDKRVALIAQELKRWEIHVIASTVRRFFLQLGCRLHANLKSLSKSHPDRDLQFQYIDHQRRRFTRQALPIISINTKKKELVGNIKNAARVWSLEPTPALDHDFRSDASHIAVPYGIYDVTRNFGSFFVGISHGTPAFVAHNVATWWRDCGRKH